MTLALMAEYADAGEDLSAVVTASVCTPRWFGVRIQFVDSIYRLINRNSSHIELTKYIVYALTHCGSREWWRKVHDSIREHRASCCCPSRHTSQFYWQATPTDVSHQYFTILLWHIFHLGVDEAKEEEYKIIISPEIALYSTNNRRVRTKTDVIFGTQRLLLRITAPEEGKMTTKHNFFPSPKPYFAPSDVILLTNLLFLFFYNMK